MDRLAEILEAQRMHAEERIKENIRIISIHQQYITDARRIILQEETLIREINALMKLPRGKRNWEG